MSAKSLCLIMVLGFGLVAVPQLVHAQVENLALNPSFEEDEVILDDPAWEQWATWGTETGLGSTVEIDDTEAVDGARSLRIEPTGTTNWHFIVLNAPLPLEVGTTYTASFWVKAEADRPLGAKMKATDNSVDWGYTDFEVTTEWAEYAMTSVAQNATAKIEFFCSGVDVTFWLDFLNVYEGEYVSGIGPSGTANPNKAARPKPADDALIETTTAELAWKAGASALTHNVYFGESFEAVDQGQVEPVTTVEASLAVGQDAPYANGLTPGATYYWRVDEVSDTDPNSPWRGDVWSFRVRPLTAWDPSPQDEILFVAPNQTLTWDTGMGVLIHNVYFGESFEEVSSATAGAWPTLEPVYDPGILEVNKTYYWRVDEFVGLTTYRGPVWSFTTVPDVAIADPDLIGWWTLDEGMGLTAVDWSGHGLHGQIVGNAAWTYGVHGGALALAGGSYVEVPAPNVQTNTMTMTAWARRDGSQPDWAAILFSREGSAVSGMGFGPANELRYHWTDQYWDFPTGIYPPDQEWFFLALVVEPTQATLYYNGTDVSVRNEAAHGPDPFDGVLRIGQDRAGRDLQGAVDDVRFYNKVLTEAELVEAMRGDMSLAWDPTPKPDALLDIRDVDSLIWSAGDGAASHNVYLGGDRQAVAGADPNSPEFAGNQVATRFVLDDLVKIDGGDYFWRIDEVQADGAVWMGTTWKFTVMPYLVVEDFEGYDDNMEAGTALFQTWIDGLDNGTGSYVGYEIAADGTFGETRIVHGGRQAMPLQYDNTVAPGLSETDRTFTPTQDWTVEGVTTLVIHFRGEPDNTGQLYAKINGVKRPYNGDPADIASTGWIAWQIDLTPAEINAAAVKTFTIGVEGGQAGTVYIDDIQLTKP